MKRQVVGLLALGMLAAAGSLWLSAGDDARAWSAALLRIGVVLAALWLALPQLRTVPRWLVRIGLAAALIVVCLSGKARVLLLAVAAYVVVLAAGGERPPEQPLRRPRSPAAGGGNRGRQA